MSNDYGIKIGPPSANVDELTDADELWFNSEFPFLKIHDSGTFTLIVDKTGGGDETISHDLGFEPVVLVYMQKLDSGGSSTSEFYQLDWSYQGAMYGGYARAGIDSSDIYIEFSDFLASDGTVQSLDGKYFVFDFDLDSCTAI